MSAEQVASSIETAVQVPASEVRTELSALGISAKEALLRLIDEIECWRTVDGIVFATVHIDGHQESHAVASREFREWLLNQLQRRYSHNERPASASDPAVREARGYAEAKAFNGKKQTTALRVMGDERTIYIDRGRPDWSAFEVTPNGWTVLPSPPVRLIRSRRTGEMLEPASTADFGPLRHLLRGLDDNSFVLFVAWCVGALSPAGPYPLLLVSGQAGTGKSTLVRVANRLVDPSNGDLQQPPREDRDLIAACKHSHLLCFDNLSAVSAELADSLCRLATGAEIGGRTLYTNHDSSAFAARKPIVLNGIPDLAMRGDLLDRSVAIRLYPLEERRTELELRKDMELALPFAFRGLLDALVMGLARLPATKSPDMRMADFGRLVIAAEPALPWAPGAFLKAFEQSRLHQLAALVDGDVVARQVIIFSRHHPNGWSGLVSDLLDQLNLNTLPDIKRLADWPRSANWLSARIDRIAAGLRVRGVEITNRRSNRGAVITIAHIAAPASPGDASDANADISITRNTARAPNGHAGH